MMTVCFFLGWIFQGCGHDDMTKQKQPKKRHHAVIPQTYDDMTIILRFPRATRCFAAYKTHFLTRSFKEYRHIVITL